MKEKIEVVMMGTLTIKYCGGLLNLPCSLTNKSIQLLLILWNNLEKGVPRARLIEMLYGNADLENPASSFRVTVFRLRKMLAQSGLPPYEYIKNDKRIYRWDTKKMDVWTDTANFCEKAEAALALSGEDPAKQLTEVCKLYTGEFLMGLFGEEWVEVERCRFEQLYGKCLNFACEYLFEKKDYQTVLDLSRTATAMYPYEEWFLFEIDSLIELNRFPEAMEAYERAATLLFNEMGLKPSSELMSRFWELNDNNQTIRGGVENIWNIQEKLAEKENTKGAYYCSLPSFIDSYRLFVRLMERSGKSIYLMLCTLTGRNYIYIGDSERLEIMIRKLRGTLEGSLRRGDVFTRLGKNQFLILLTGAKQESCSAISKRIEKNFKEDPETWGIHLSFLWSSAVNVIKGDGEGKFNVANIQWEEF